MAKVVSYNEADTAITGASQNLTISALNYGADWVPTQTIAGQTQLSYVRTLPDAKSTIRYASTPIANIYTGSSVDASYQLPNKRGLSLLGQTTQVVTITDSADSTYRIDLPFSTHWVFRAPLTNLLSEDQMYHVFARGLSSCVDRAIDSNDNSVRLWQLLFGQMTPKNV